MTYAEATLDIPADSFLAEAQAPRPAEGGRPRERTALLRWS